MCRHGCRTVGWSRRPPHSSHAKRRIASCRDASSSMSSRVSSRRSRGSGGGFSLETFGERAGGFFGLELPMRRGGPGELRDCCDCCSGAVAAGSVVAVGVAMGVRAVMGRGARRRSAGVWYLDFVMTSSALARRDFSGGSASAAAPKTDPPPRVGRRSRASCGDERETGMPLNGAEVQRGRTCGGRGMGRTGRLEAMHGHLAKGRKLQGDR